MGGVTRNEQAVKFIIERASGRIGRTHLQKLLYLADIEARKHLGRPITDFEWVWWSYGPFDQTVYTVVWWLRRQGEIAESSDAEEDGYIYESLKASEQPDLSGAERQILDELVNRFINLPAWRIREASYRTEPMVDARERDARGERLRMEIVDNIGRDQLLGMDMERIVAGKERFDRGEPGIPIEQVIGELLGHD